MYNIHKFIEEAVKKANETGKADTAKFWQELSKNQIALVHLRLELSKAGVDETVITSVNVDKFIQKETSNVDVTDMSKVLSFVNDVFATSIKDATKPSTEAGASTTEESGTHGSEGGARRRRSVTPHIEGETHEQPVSPAPDPVEDNVNNPIINNGKRLKDYTASDFDTFLAYYDFDNPNGDGKMLVLHEDEDRPFDLNTSINILVMKSESETIEMITIPSLSSIFTVPVKFMNEVNALIRPQDNYVEGEERDLVYIDTQNVYEANTLGDVLRCLTLESMSNTKPYVETPAGGAEATSESAVPEEEAPEENVGSSNPSGKVITVTFKGGEYFLINGKAKKKVKVRGQNATDPVDLGDLSFPTVTIKPEYAGRNYSAAHNKWNVESEDGTINGQYSEYNIMYLQGVNSNLTLTPVLEVAPTDRL